MAADTSELGRTAWNLTHLEANGSIGSQTEPRGPVVPGVLRYVALALYLTTFVLGITGNSLTILVITCQKKMKTVASVFILNLAIADDLFMLSLPFMAHSTFIGKWIFGSVLCKLMTAFYGTNLYASIFTMVLMSVDRLLAIAWPLRSRRYRTVGKAAIVCVGIWVVCVIIMTPYWIHGDLHPQTSRCGTLWPIESRLEHLWFWANFELITGFLAPVIIMVLCYSNLLRHIFRSRGAVHDQAKTPVRKVTLMLFIVTLVFVICWTPYHIIQYASIMNHKYYTENLIQPPRDKLVRFVIFNTVAQALVFVSSCCNPIIYGISSKNFRQMYYKVLCGCCNKQISNNGTSYATHTGSIKRTKVSLLKKCVGKNSHNGSLKMTVLEIPGNINQPSVVSLKTDHNMESNKARPVAM